MTDEEADPLVNLIRTSVKFDVHVHVQATPMRFVVSRSHHFSHLENVGEQSVVIMIHYQIWTVI